MHLRIKLFFPLALCIAVFVSVCVCECVCVRTLRNKIPPQQWVEYRFNSIHLLDDEGFSKSDRQLQGCHEVTIL